MLDPDKQVRETIGVFFETFGRHGTAGATVKAFEEQGLRFPSRPVCGANQGEVGAPNCWPFTPTRSRR